MSQLISSYTNVNLRLALVRSGTTIPMLSLLSAKIISSCLSVDKTNYTYVEEFYTDKIDCKCLTNAMSASGEEE